MLRRTSRGKGHKNSTSPNTVVGEVVWLTPPPTTTAHPDTFSVQAQAIAVSGQAMPALTPISYSSSDRSVATVTSTGSVTTVAAGTVTISATSGDKTVTGEVEITATGTPQSITVNPTSVSIPDGSSSVVEARVWDGAGGTGNVLGGQTVTWQSLDTDFATVGADSGDPVHQTLVTTVAEGGPVNVRATSGAFTADCAVTVIAPSSLPSGYDPDRLGVNLLWSPYHHQQPLGSDSFALIERPAGSGGPGVFVPRGAYINDPHNVFGVVKQVNNVAGTTATLQGGKNFTTATPIVGPWWYRMLFLWDGNGNAVGTGPASSDGGPYSEWWTADGTLEPGGSKTYKMCFAWHVPYVVNGQTKANRMAMTMGPGDGFEGSPQVGHLEAGKIETLLGQGGAPVPPAGSNFNVRAVPTLGGTPIADPHNQRGNKDWYEWVFRYEPVDATSYYQIYFIRRLTVDGVLDPWDYPLWKGWLITNGLAQPYYNFQVTGNKSQANDGPNDQYTNIGPVELTDAADPYGWLNYGK